MRTLLSIVILGILFCSCGNSPYASQNDPGTDLPGTSWKLKTKDNAVPTLTFDKDLSEISGYTGCNNYNADVEQIGPTIKFSSFFRTEMACESSMEQEREFMIALSEVFSFVQVNNTLSLKDRSGRTVLTFKRAD